MAEHSLSGQLRPEYPHDGIDRVQNFASAPCLDCGRCQESRAAAEAHAYRSDPDRECHGVHRPAPHFDGPLLPCAQCPVCHSICYSSDNWYAAFSPLHSVYAQGSAGIVFNLIAVRIHMSEMETTQATSTNILTGISRWTGDHLSTNVTELDEVSSHLTDDESPPIRLKSIRAPVQADSLSNGGYSRSIDAR